jgi:hypothetical protein
MFALDELRRFRVPYAEFNEVVGYNQTFVPQGFSVLDATRSALVFDWLSLQSDRHPPAVTREQIESALAGLHGETERAVAGTQRLEQSFLRRALMPETSARCTLCGEEFPVEFLVAAHVKKRSECTNDERLDIPAIGMPACKFGCDALYEAGYLGVDEAGSVVVSRWAPRDSVSRRYLHRYAGRSAGTDFDLRRVYFDWHMQHTFKQ